MKAPWHDCPCISSIMCAKYTYFKTNCAKSRRKPPFQKWGSFYEWPFFKSCLKQGNWIDLKETTLCQWQVSNCWSVSVAWQKQSHLTNDLIIGKVDLRINRDFLFFVTIVLWSEREKVKQRETTWKQLFNMSTWEVIRTVVTFRDTGCFI